jgi:hypothetical protein
MKRATCVQQARHVLVESFGLSINEADLVLQTLSTQRNTSVADIAYVFVHHVWQGEPDPVDHSLVRAVEKQLRQLPIEVDQSHLESEHSRTAS